MKCLLEVCLIGSVLTAACFSSAQSPEIPLQRGVSVDMPVTAHAVPVPAADKEDALVLAVTRDGNVWLGVERVAVSALPELVRSALANRVEKTLYIKADSQVPYAKVIQLIDLVRTAGVERLALLTSQRDPRETGKLAVPKGIQIRIVGADSSVQK